MAKKRALSCTFKNRIRVKRICKQSGFSSRDCKSMKDRLRRGCK